MKDDMPHTYLPIETRWEDFRIEQAQLLKENAPRSCIVVAIVVALNSSLVAFEDNIIDGVTWFCLAQTMVLITYLYARFAAPNGIGRDEYQTYLTGHIMVSGATGLIWGGFAIYNVELDSWRSIFLAIFIVANIVTGGVLPTSIYRPGYIALSACALLPLSVYFLTIGPGSISLVGLFLLVFFALSLMSSAKVEYDTRSGIFARQAEQLNNELMAKNKLVEAQSEEKSRLLAATGHDLAQPLQAQGFFMAALRPMLKEAQQIDVLQKMEESWEIQKQLLGGIIEMARINSGAVVPAIKDFPVQDILKRLAGEIEVELDGDIDFQHQFCSVVVTTDPVLLSRIIGNLLTNAVKFTPTGGHVEFIARRRGDRVDVCVRDDGPGIAEKDHDRIFGEYVKLNSTDKPGMGLGLSIVRKLSDLLDIEITLRSELGRGTEFHILVPIALADNIANPRLNSPRNQPDARDLHFDRRISVLLVDDDVAIFNSMAIMIRGWGCDVVTAASYGDALEAANGFYERHEPIDLMIVDRQLGEEDGVSLIQEIRAQNAANIPALILSGDIHALEHIKDGFSIQLLSKPADPVELFRIMEMMIDDTPNS